MHICIFEDSQDSGFLPLSYFRPVFDLRCGALSLRAKLQSQFHGSTYSFLVRSELQDLFREENPRLRVNAPEVEDTWFINGSLIPDDHVRRIIRSQKQSKAFWSGTSLACAFVGADAMSRMVTELCAGMKSELFARLPSNEYEGRIARYPWDLMTWTAEEIERDSHLLRKKKQKHSTAGISRGAHLLNRKNILLGANATVKPGAVLDAEHGPIVLGRNVTIMPNAVIEGPCFIGDYSVIKAGAKIYHGTSIGEYSKVGGEVEASIIQSYSNKQHDGFLGHSYLGSWVNIGADTNTSDLKNTYGSVSVRVNGKQHDTGLQFVGLTMGDHSKTGINVMFDTGSIVGCSCNVYGSGLPPKYLSSFAWGSPGSFVTYDLEKSLETARRVMTRRSVAMTPVYERRLREVFEATAADRRSSGVC